MPASTPPASHAAPDAPRPPAGVHHVAIQVRDLPRTETFYRDVLGLPVLRRWPAPDGGGHRSVWLDLGGDAFLALEVVPDAAPQIGPAAEETATGDPAADRASSRPGLHLLALAITAEARAAWETRLVAAGHPVIHRTDFSIYVRDPEGNRLGLSHWPTPRNADARPDDARGGG